MWLCDAAIDWYARCTAVVWIFSFASIFHAVPKWYRSSGRCLVSEYDCVWVSAFVGLHHALATWSSWFCYKYFKTGGQSDVEKNVVSRWIHSWNCMKFEYNFPLGAENARGFHAGTLLATLFALFPLLGAFSDFASWPDRDSDFCWWASRRTPLAAANRMPRSRFN